MPTSLENLPISVRVSTEDVIQEMPQPIAFVGNGPVAADYGQQIDEYATVIRCNNFRLAGHEATVGTKTTHWCLHGMVDRVSFMPIWQRMIANTFWRGRTVGIQRNPHVTAQMPCFSPKAFDWIPVEMCKKYLDLELCCLRDASLLYPVQAVSRYPTTGFATLYLLLQFQPLVSVFGFSGLAQGHYWNKSHRHTVRHMPTADRELELIRHTSRVKFHA